MSQAAGNDAVDLVVLYEDNHLLIVDKPAGLLVQEDRTGDPTLVELAQKYRCEKEAKPGKAYIGLVHRLDRRVSGIVLLARTSKAAARLSEQFRSHLVDKRYLAVVEDRSGRLAGTSPWGGSWAKVSAADPSGIWEDILAKDRRTNQVRRLEPGPGLPSSARAARTAWQLCTRSSSLALLQLRPMTGRSHQLRVQAASRGLPIVGDRKYGSSLDFDGAIALHAYFLAFTHPVSGTSVRIWRPPPKTWDRFELAISTGLEGNPGAQEGPSNCQR